MVPIMQIVATCSLHVCLAVSVCVCLCLCLSQSVSVSVYVSVCLSLSVSVCLSLSMSLCVCLCLCRSMYVCIAVTLSSDVPLCLQQIRGGVGECVCEESRCPEGYKRQHCESYDISVIEVSPTHLPQHNLLKSLHSLPHQCAGQQNCELIGQRCLQYALEVWSSGRTPATTQPAPTSTLSTPPSRRLASKFPLLASCTLSCTIATAH